MSTAAPALTGVDQTTGEAEPTIPVDRSWPRRFVLGAIALVAMAVRIPGVFWGLPNELHPDEPLIIQNALDLVKRKSLSPRVFDRPDHLEIILSSFAYRMYAWLDGAGSVPADYAMHSAHYLAISRCITVAFSVAAVLFAWCVGRRFSTATALIAALLVAFFPPFIANSSYATPDMPLTCLMLAVILASMRYLERPTLLRLLFACAAVGVGVTIKYPAAIAGVTVGGVILTVMVRSRAWRRGAQHLLLAPVFFSLTVLAVSHVLVTDLSEVIFQLHNQRGSNHLGAEALGWTGNMAYYGRYYASWAGVLQLAAALFGAWYCIRERVVIATPLLLGYFYWIGLSEVPAHWDRWGLPMFLTPLLFAAVGIGRIVRSLEASRRAKNLRSRLLLGVMVGLMAICAAQLFTGSAVVVAGFAGPDTRVVAMPAFRAAGINEKTAAFDGYTPILPGAPRSIVTQVQFVGGQVRIEGKPGAQYIVISSYMYDRYFANSRLKAAQAIYNAVRHQLPLMQQWTPVPLPERSALESLAIMRSVRYVDGVVRGGYTGPTIAVYVYNQ